MTSQIYDTAAVVLDLHCTGIIARMILLIHKANNKDVSETLYCYFSENRIAQFAQFYKIVLHTFKFLLHTLCSETHYFRPCDDTPYTVHDNECAVRRRKAVEQVTGCWAFACSTKQ